MTSRPGCYILYAGVRYEITESYDTVYGMLDGLGRKKEFIQLTRHDTGKKITFRTKVIDVIIEGGF